MEDKIIKGEINNQKINYQLILDKKIEEIEKSSTRPSLLLHSCCGPCSSYILEYLSFFFDISILYYNPNIYPSEEFYFRENEQKELITKMGLEDKVKFIRAPYSVEEFYDKIRGHEADLEGGNRCFICYELRLDYTARIAKEMVFDYFTTSLSISPHKNSQILNKIGGSLADKYGINYLYSDFKKKSGFKRSVELTNDYDMYRQDYCGCIFSYRAKKERNRRSS